MPENPRLTEPANGLTRCQLCSKVGPPHKHSVWVWVGYRWERNRGIDRLVVLLYVGLWMVALGWWIAFARDVAASWLT